jgi:uncharacterized glyoxalase superfamily protein PhnB
MYKKLTANMMVEDVSQTVGFYRDILGFELVIGVPRNSQEIVTTVQEGQTLDFAIVKGGNVEMMFQARQSLTDEIPELSGLRIGGSLTLYVEVDDVQGLCTRLRDKVVAIKDIQTKFYGKREFSIRDCNGYILTFAGSI